MVSISELKQLRDYYKEKIEYLKYLLEHETYYFDVMRKYKHENYKHEIKELEVSLVGISKEIDEIEKVTETKVDRKYTPNRVIIKKRTSKSPKRKTRSLSPTVSENIETIRSSFKSKKTKPKSKRVRSEPAKSRSKSKSNTPKSKTKKTKKSKRVKSEPPKSRSRSKISKSRSKSRSRSQSKSKK